MLGMWACLPFLPANHSDVFVSLPQIYILTPQTVLVDLYNVCRRLGSHQTEIERKICCEKNYFFSVNINHFSFEREVI